jgi:TolB-like protein
MRTLFCSWLLLVSLLFPFIQVQAQLQSPATHTLIILPFENTSKVPGIEWIGEAFPEVLGQRLTSPQVYVISREDRIAAFDRLGIPLTIRPSRATLFRIADQMDVDYMLVGDYNFDGQTFSARAQLMDMRKLRLSPEMRSYGPLPKLLDVQNSIAWEVARQLAPQVATNKEQFLRASSGVRLDALEAYVRGISAGTRQEKIKYLRDALRLNPSYSQAILELGKTFFDGREYAQAAKTLASASKTDATAGEASFLLGLSAFYTGDYARAQDAFEF